jgi:surface protein
MKKIEKIKKLLKANYNLKTSGYEYFPETNEELIELIDKMINECGDKVDLNKIDVSCVNDFKDVFYDKRTFDGDVSEWDVLNGLNFVHMFYGCDLFNCDLSKWNVSNGKEFSGMFYKCGKFNADLSEWDVSNGIYFSYMFYRARLFNADLSNWNVLNAKTWFAFAEESLLEKYPEKIPYKFRIDYL